MHPDKEPLMKTPSFSQTKPNQTEPLRLISLAILLIFSGSAMAEINIPDTPLAAGQAGQPLVMLTASKDLKLFYDAYNDVTDLDGDGVIDTHFRPSIWYYGLFDNKLCYNFVGSEANLASAYFTPGSVAVADGSVSPVDGAPGPGKCVGTWSGNFLNYVTTSRMDALRKVLYGGWRDVDSTTQTIVRRAYIPQDVLSWAKEYTSVAVDGYSIANYTPYAVPATGRRHFFGNLTVLTAACGTTATALEACRKSPPRLVVAQNSTKRVWDWASSEAPVLNENTTFSGTNTYARFSVRVEVCTPLSLANPDEGCKQYGTRYKPTGVLHSFGEDDSILFGLLTGSYDKNMSGGRLRKVISSFKGEVNPLTGQFTANNDIVKTFNNIAIRDWRYAGSNAYRNGLLLNAPMTEGNYVDWGNPFGEMLYESMRYLGSKGVATTNFAGSTTIDTQVGLPVATWNNPYASAPWCAKPAIIAISDLYPSYDSDLAGNPFGGTAIPNDLTGFNASTLANEIWTLEGMGSSGSYFIGQSGTVYDGVPTAKTVTGFGNIRGLVPEEPSKQGTYYSAAVAYFGKHKGLGTFSGQKRTVDTYMIALASPLPEIKVPVGGGKTVTVVPFGKSVSYTSGSINATKGQFQPTLSIVDFYLESIANSTGSGGADYDPAINGGSYSATFQINFEDVEQGNDHDMDFIVQYKVELDSSGKVIVKVIPTYQSAGVRMNAGYTIAGTTADGAYLAVQSVTDGSSIGYYLNVPDSKTLGWCDNTANLATTTCRNLPACSTSGTFGACTVSLTARTSSRTFTAGSGSAQLLKNPLWYAAKWGGSGALDAKGDPTNYFLVQNPLTLKDSLQSALNSILPTNASSGNIISDNGKLVSGSTLLFQTTFTNTDGWHGDLLAHLPVAGPIDVNHPAWKASEYLPGSRTIFTRNDSGDTVDFTWNLGNLSSTQQHALSNAGALNGADVLNYIRGDQSKEGTSPGDFRSRVSVLGDSPNNAPYYVPATNVVYVGANDGMLHAFDAVDGKELFAYIPSSLIPNLHLLTAQDYGHMYYVDGEVAVSTAGQTPGRSYLVGSLGRGGQGVFGLDVTAVTNGATIEASDVANWELNKQCVPGGVNMGYVFPGAPTIAKLNAVDGSGNKIVAAIIGNGYNNCDNQSVLYIVNVATGAIVREIAVPAAFPGSDGNGLSAPAVLNTDGDVNNTVDVVYAGDLDGRLWRFDLSATNPASWKVDFNGVAIPMFVSGATQPITAAPTVAIQSDGSNNVFVFIGTGRFINTTDRSNHAIQSWYGLIDNDDPDQITRIQLVEREFQSDGTVHDVALNEDFPVRTIAVANSGDMVGKRGWFVDFKIPADEGERVVSRSVVVTAVAGTVLEVSSIIPNDDVCAAGGRGYINYVDAFTGARVNYPFLDLNGDGEINADDVGESSRGVGGLPGQLVLATGMSTTCSTGVANVVGDSTGKVTVICKNLGSRTGFKGRVSWREIVR
jgi:type IV pilus assembly protein PilY1